MRPDRAIVIGAGPAGSLAALLLARAGVNVTLIEQSRFPRDKVCGECLSATGLHVLRRHQIISPEAAGVRLNRACLYGTNESADLGLPSPMLGLSRAALDTILLDEAVAAGVRIIQPARVERVDDAGDRCVVHTRSLPGNERSHHETDIVMAADGRGLFGRERPALSADLGIKAHFVNVAADPDAITLYGGIGLYGGVAPIEGGRWNVAFSVPKMIVQETRGDLEAWWNATVERHSIIRRHFRSARRISEWLASPLPRHPAPSGNIGRVIPVGAAAGAIEPVGGEGMGTALRSAELAAAAVLNNDVASLPAAYRRLWQRRGLFCRLGGRLLPDPIAGDLVGLANTPLVGRLAMALVGK